MNRVRIRIRELARIGETFVRLDALEELSYPLSLFFTYSGFLLPVVIQFFVSQLVDNPRNVGGDYFTFSVVGLAVSAAMQQTLNKLGNRLQQMQNRGVLETLLVEPVSWAFLPVAMNVWHWMTGFLSMAVILVAGGLLGANFELSNIGSFLVVAVFAMLSGSAIGIASGAVLIFTKRSSPVITLYGLAASLLGGVVFPIELLPGWVQPLSRLVPHAYAIGAARQTLMSNPPQDVAFATAGALTTLGAFAVVVLPLSVVLFDVSLRRARDRGILGTY